MAAGSYKKWTKEERNFSYKLTIAAEKLGWIKQRKNCNRCAQDKGIIHLHNEDYDVTTNVLSEAILNRKPASITEEEKAQINEVLETLCWRCHMIHHSGHRNPDSAAEYWNTVKKGMIWPPVYAHNFGILKTDHNI